MTTWFLLAAVALLLANAFFVAVEFALVTSRRERLEQMAASGRRSAQIALGSTRELSLQLAGAQLGVTMASLGLGFVGEPALADVIESLLHPLDLSEGLLRVIGFGTALLIVTFAHLVIGEMVPKNLAIAGPEKTMLILAIPNRIYVTVFRPVIWSLNRIANGGVRLLGVEPKSELAVAHTGAELAAMLAVSHDEGMIQDFEHDLMAGALGFGDRPVSAVMIPREQIRAVSSDSTLGEIEALINASGHSRLPVMAGDLDHIRGFVHVKDLLRVADEDKSRPFVRNRPRPMMLIRDDQSLEEVLLRMRSRRMHLGLVIDSQRRTQGLVTLEDVLEALVGDIRDESDPQPEPGGSGQLAAPGSSQA